MQEQKLRGYLNIARKANYLVIGQDNLKGYDKKLYLVLVGKNSSTKSKQLATNICQKLQIPHFQLSQNLEDLLAIKNCQIVGLKNNGLASQIINLLTWE